MYYIKKIWDKTRPRKTIAEQSAISGHIEHSKFKCHALVRFAVVLLKKKFTRKANNLSINFLILEEKWF